MSFDDKVSPLKRYFNFAIAGHSKPHQQRLKHYYTDILNGHKKLKCLTIIMSPDDFLKHAFVGKDINSKDPHIGKIIDRLKKSLVDKIPDKYKWALPVIDICDKKRMGAFRAQTMKDMDIDCLPVLIVGNSILEIQDWLDEKGIKYQIYIR